MKSKSLLVTITIMLGALSSMAQVEGTFTDSRDGRIYKTVKIGTQTMMAENLAYKPASGNYWAFNADPKYVATNGYLYDWETAKKACPAGWHLPAKKDYDILIKISSSNSEGQFDYLIKYGDSGFSSSESGYRDADGVFFDFDSKASYWCSTPYSNDQAWYLLLDRDDTSVKMSYAKKIVGFSVRCFKD